jgi:hypothetical protein
MTLESEYAGKLGRSGNAPLVYLYNALEALQYEFANENHE